MDFLTEVVTYPSKTVVTDMLIKTLTSSWLLFLIQVPLLKYTQGFTRYFTKPPKGLKQSTLTPTLTLKQILRTHTIMIIVHHLKHARERGPPPLQQLEFIEPGEFAHFYAQQHF
jgi:hypothetical protein